MTIARTKALGVGLAVALLSAWAAEARALTDDDVLRAINKGREFLINQQNADGSFGKNAATATCDSALAFMTLAYMGEHPNHDVMSKGLDYLMKLDAKQFTHGGGLRCGYAVPIRVMGFAYVSRKIGAEKKTLLKQKMREDILRMQTGQNPDGGWRYALDKTDYDFSVTQWPILAMREANEIGIEMPMDCLKKARDLYFKMQNKDGGWHYQSGKSYGSMTAAGLASLYIINDVLDPSGGCPCGSHTAKGGTETERRIESALEWISKYFTAADNPESGGQPGAGRLRYWLYCVERVGISAGYKYFGKHNWYKEGADVLVKSQSPAGDWGGDMSETCFCLLFLYKGRAPVLFNKLRFDGTWDAHRRDMANLTHYIERFLEEQFHWQIVDLQEPIEELHDAPVLYITADSVPKFTDDEKKKLRQFTDTGGTVLVEASCGNAAVRDWFTKAGTGFAKEIWPEWNLTKLSKDHVTFKNPNPLGQVPDILGLDDGVRTFVFYCPEDVSCHWQTKAFAAKEYLFKWGINLYTYATDQAPLRAKLQTKELSKDRYKDPVKAGGTTSLKIARMKYGGDWWVGANYNAFAGIAKVLKERAAVALEVKEPTAAPITDGGVAPTDLKGNTAAYMAGSREFTMAQPDKDALKAYVDGGGFLWAESVDGSPKFDAAFRALAKDLGWELKLLTNTDPLMTGRMDPAVGYNLTQGIQFRHDLKTKRLGRNFAEFQGLYSGGKMIGVYSPFDIVFSSTPYEAGGCLGYKMDDANAVAINVLLYMTTLK